MSAQYARPPNARAPPAATPAAPARCPALYLNSGGGGNRVLLHPDGRRQNPHVSRCAGRTRGGCLARALPRRAKVWGRVSTRARVHGMHLAMRTSIRIAEKCSAGSQLFPRARPQKSTYSWWALEQVGYADRGPHSRKVFTRVATFSSNPSTKVDIFVVAPREGWLCGPRSA